VEPNHAAIVLWTNSDRINANDRMNTTRTTCSELIIWLARIVASKYFTIGEGLMEAMRDYLPDHKTATLPLWKTTSEFVLEAISENISSLSLLSEVAPLFAFIFTRSLHFN